MAITIDPTKDYRYSNFMNAKNLAGTDWKGVDLTGSNFRGAILSGSKLDGCNLQFCNFSECNLNGAHFDSNSKTGGSAWVKRIPANANGKQAQNIPPSIDDADDTIPIDENFEEETEEPIEDLVK